MTNIFKCSSLYVPIPFYIISHSQHFITPFTRTILITPLFFSINTFLISQSFTLFAHEHLHKHVSIHSFTSYIYMHKHAHTHTHILTYAHTYTYIFTRTHTHTHVHIPLQWCRPPPTPPGPSRVGERGEGR